MVSPSSICTLKFDSVAMYYIECSLKEWSTEIITIEFGFAILYKLSLLDWHYNTAGVISYCFILYFSDAIVAKLKPDFSKDMI